MKVVRSGLRTGRLYPPGNIPGTHFCQRSQGHSAAGLCQWKIQMTPPGIEPATYRQSLNQPRHGLPLHIPQNTDNLLKVLVRCQLITTSWSRKIRLHSTERSILSVLQRMTIAYGRTGVLYETNGFVAIYFIFGTGIWVTSLCGIHFVSAPYFHVRHYQT